uniref:Glycoside hydrolase family 43 protein n=1 Tax=Bionectria ochroleuca TaxID=29856 RepID=A0A8H7K321_BIOOC
MNIYSLMTFLLRFTQINRVNQQALKFQNPLRNGTADPSMVWADGQYHLTYTSGGKHIEITRAANLMDLAQGEPKVVWEDSNSTRSADIWAPEIHQIDDVWHIFYSSRDANVIGSYRTRVLRGCNGTNPTDCEYTFGADLVPPVGKRGGPDGKNAYSIDGTYMEIPGKGRYHVLSMRDENNVQSLGITTLNTTTWKVDQWHVISRPDYEWEKYMGKGAGAQALAVGAGLNEGPYALYNGDDVWLSYSASSCDTPQYALGLLYYNGGDPLQASSWNKTGPVFQSANGNYGTAHNSFFKSPDGTQTWNLFHATSNSKGGCGVDRYTMTQLLTFDDDGTPNLGQPQRLHTDITPPSGESWI